MRKKKKSNVETKPMSMCTRAFLSIKKPYFLSSIFSLFFGENFLVSLGRNIYGPHHLFSFLPIQSNTVQKSFYSHFLFKIFHSPYFNSKQTHS